MTVGTDEEVRGCIEMMSGAVWVRDRLALVGWDIRLAAARKVKSIAPLACKTDRVDARMLADLVRRERVPEVWVADLEERANGERLRRRSHLIRLRTWAINRSFALLTQWGLRRNLTALRKPDAIAELAGQGVPGVWLQSITTLLAVIEDLDRQLAVLDGELRPVASADDRVRLLMSIPGIGELLGLTIASEIGARLPSARKLVATRPDPDDQAVPAELTHRPALQGRPGHPCAGPPSRPPSRPGGRTTRGTASAATPSTATARATPPRPPSPARS